MRSNIKFQLAEGTSQLEDKSDLKFIVSHQQVLAFQESLALDLLQLPQFRVIKGCLDVLDTSRLDSLPTMNSKVLFSFGFGDFLLREQILAPIEVGRTRLLLLHFTILLISL